MPNAASMGKISLAALAAALALGGLPAPCAAQAPQRPAAVETQEVRGIVTKIERSKGRLTVRHHGIAELDMPGMAISLVAGPGVDLSAFEPGETVMFKMARVDYHYTMTQVRSIQKAPPGYVPEP